MCMVPSVLRWCAVGATRYHRILANNFELFLGEVVPLILAGCVICAAVHSPPSVEPDHLGLLK